MERIVLRHLSGSKANQVEEFPLNHFKELTIGRDPATTVKYDPDRDDLVGRQHAKITQDPADPTAFTLTDLNSRNGTYLNKQRIVGSAKIVPGDVVQFGPGGPEFQFDLEPRPANAVRTTRIASDASAVGIGGGVPATRVSDTGGGHSAPGPLVGPPPTGAAAPPPIGRQTVERMVAQSKSDSRKFLALGVIAVLLIVMVGGAVAYVLYRKHQDELARQSQGDLGGLAGKLAKVEEKTSAMSAADIFAKYTGAVVWIEASWKLIFTGTGGQVYHRYYPFKGKTYPLYYPTGDGRYLPMLTLDSANNLNQPIGGSLGGSGFVISNDGFILTNRHVAANWFAPMSLPPGLVVALDQMGNIVTDEQGNIKFLGSLDQGISNWIPAEAVKNRSLMGKALEGRNDYLDVTFADNKTRIPAAGPPRVSDEHDVAMIKINLPEPVPAVQLFDNYDSIKAGDTVTVIGYPLATQIAPVAVRIKGQAGGLGPSDRVAFVPEPTVTTGIVARVIQSKNDPNYFTSGDEYQHTAATNPGNSGGPVFDQYGRVIAVHFAGYSSGVQGANFAVPIKYGMDLMGTRTVSGGK